MDSINILIGGDFIPPENAGNIYTERLNNILLEKDYSLINLECPFVSNIASGIAAKKKIMCRPRGVLSLINGHFNAVTIANNHIKDFGDDGVKTTINICRANNIKTIGAGKNLEEARQPLIIDLKEKRIAFLNYTEIEFSVASNENAGANPFETINAFYDIEKLRKSVDFIFVIYHGGIEYKEYPTTELVNTFKFLIDIGADAVISHHTHYYGGYIFYKNKPIVFSLGNFIAKTIVKSHSQNWLIGLLAKIKIYDSVVDLDLIPIIQNSTFDKIDIVIGSQREKILEEIENRKEIINDEERLNSYWLTQYQKSRRQILTRLFSNSKFEYKLRKRLPFSLVNISDFKLLILLNSLRCTSHRNELIKILEGIYNQRHNKCGK